MMVAGVGIHPERDAGPGTSAGRCEKAGERAGAADGGGGGGKAGEGKEVGEEGGGSGSGGERGGEERGGEGERCSGSAECQTNDSAEGMFFACLPRVRSYHHDVLS
eukprot:3527677-Rhodomonas_salina.9